MHSLPSKKLEEKSEKKVCEIDLCLGLAINDARIRFGAERTRCPRGLRCLLVV